MAQFRNVSGVDRSLSLPDWYEARFVEAAAVVEVDDDLAAKYDFNQPGIWEWIEAPKAKDEKNGSN